MAKDTIRELEDRRYRAMCEADAATLDKQGRLAVPTGPGLGIEVTI